MSRNSMEKRPKMMEKNHLNRSRCNPESSPSIVIPTTPSTKQQRLLEESVSAKNLHINGDSLENRYRALKDMYKSLLDKVTDISPNLTQQTKQLEKLREIHQKNEKEIRMLRGMLGFLNKQDKNIQTQIRQAHENKSKRNISINIKSYTNLPKHFCSPTRDNTNFAAIKTKTQESQTQSKIGSPIFNKSLMIKTKDTNREQENLWVSKTTKNFQSTLNLVSSKKPTRCPSPARLNQKYRFIPSLPLS